MKTARTNAAEAANVKAALDNPDVAEHARNDQTNGAKSGHGFVSDFEHRGGLDPANNPKIRAAVDKMKEDRNGARPPNQITYRDGGGVEYADEHLSLDESNAARYHYNRAKIDQIKSDYETEGKISDSTREMYGDRETTWGDYFSNKAFGRTDQTGHKPIRIQEDPQAQIAVSELQEDPARKTEALKKVGGAKTNAEHEFSAAQQGLTWWTNLTSATVQSMQSGIIGAMKIDQADHAQSASIQNADAGLYRTGSSNLSQVAGTYSSGSVSFVQQANSGISSIMDAARRASAKN